MRTLMGRTRLYPLERKLTWRIDAAEQRYAMTLKKVGQARSVLENSRNRLEILESRRREKASAAGQVIDLADYEQDAERWYVAWRRHEAASRSLAAMEESLRAMGDELSELKLKRNVLHRRLEKQRRWHRFETERLEHTAMDELWLVRRGAYDRV